MCYLMIYVIFFTVFKYYLIQTSRVKGIKSAFRVDKMLFLV